MAATSGGDDARSPGGASSGPPGIGGSAAPGIGGPLGDLGMAATLTAVGLLFVRLSSRLDRLATVHAAWAGPSDARRPCDVGEVGRSAGRP
ncbi:hypothetical protein AB0M95_05675 [Sphaerisporangium sp. NPDC051017]|uniref:hypothetical protein n=1 Tax=Sphaerisporangium sp. NPDC051017 TaxID=3154636 RepID=UPI00344484D0